MKKYQLLLIAIALLLTLAGCAADKKKDIQWDAASVKYEALGGDEFGFNINVLTKHPSPKVELVRLAGENTDGLTATVHNDTFEEIKELKHCGMYLNLIGLRCETPNDYVKIDSVTLKVDSQEIVITFPHPVIHRVEEKKMVSDALQFLSVPSIVATNTHQETEITYAFAAEQNVRVTDFQFNRFWKLKNARLLINGTDEGALQDQLPLLVKKGQQVEIKGFLEFDGQMEYSDYDGIYCNAVISYTTQHGEDGQLVAKLVSQSVANAEDAAAVIDRILT
ncbi:MAG: hypothetical protein SPF51_00215 [Candidatus Fimivicinus sp.]|nr:hypothetical protein [Oscillospiraceae bacterium]MDY5589962.1 hypothetical protein [Candidatus Fimivicinus sp.]